MSAKNRGTKPIANDAYPTPPWAVRRLLDRIRVSPGEFLEPAYGTGAIVNAVDQYYHAMGGPGPAWTAVDITMGVDFLTWQAPQVFSVAITNPPFSLAFEFAKKMVSIARHSFLLTRLNILEAGKKSGRLKWLQENTPDVYVLPDRPCFSHNVRCACSHTNYPIAWDAPSLSTCCGRCGHPLRRTAGTDAAGYCWLHWDSSKLPRSSGRITHLAETPKSERVDRIVP